MLETRVKKIFDYLTEDYKIHTAEEIGGVLELSPKTIRTEIGVLNDYLKGRGGEVQSLKGKGYQFVIYDQREFENFLKKDRYKIAFYQQDYNNKDFRLESILSLFLFSNSYIKQQELAELFYVSHSQINKDIREVRKVLEKYDLKLSSKPYYGMKVTGSELDIRRCIKNELDQDENLFSQDENKELYKKVEDTIEEVLIEEPSPYYMPYVNFKNLVIHIYIAILRIRANEYVSYDEGPEDRKDLEKDDLYQVAQRIGDRLSEVLDIDFPEEEVAYVAIHLITKNRVADQEKISPEVSILAGDMLERVYQTTRYDFRDNMDLYFSLCQHLGPLLERIRFGLDMKNPILSDIKKYPLSFNLATIGGSIINERYKTHLSEDEIGYLALHFAVAIENKGHKKKDILLVCGSGTSSSQLMKIQLEKKFPQDIKSLEIVDLPDLDKKDLEAYDLIVTSVDLNRDTKTPVIRVDVIFKERDYRKLSRRMNPSGIRLIYKIFDTSIFIRTDQVKTKEEAFEQIGRELSKRAAFPEEEILASLEEREALGSTAFDYGLAVPHLMKQISDETILLIMILDRKINRDEKKVDLIFSLSVGKKEKGLDLFYEKLASFMTEEEAIEGAKKAKTRDEFLEFFMNEGGISE